MVLVLDVIFHYGPGSLAPFLDDELRRFSEIGLAAEDHIIDLGKAADGRIQFFGELQSIQYFGHGILAASLRKTMRGLISKRN